VTQAGKTARAVAWAVARARRGERVLMVVVNVAQVRRQVLAHNGGAWPRGLRLAACEDGTHIMSNENVREKV
jgi:hypothetical protein